MTGRLKPHLLALAGGAGLALLLGGGTALAQSLSLDLGGEGGMTSNLVQVVVLITVLSLAPSLLVVVTSFGRLVIVLSLLRSAIGAQTTPPNTILIGLALFLTAFIMAPTFDKAWRDGINPYMQGQLDERAAFDATAAPFRAFMLKHTREQDLALFVNLSEGPSPATPEAVPLTTIVPAFMISELRRAFEIGFLLFVPFLVIDMVIASVLMGMGMMMLPPVVISLPFKLIFFVLVDGWSLVVASLIQSYGT
ncbi:flagellar type III secretion system pore protein FliP [Zavarzinia sp.]|uniref:flagellar type III secretion system pore protein FliP n=1 Tax=Zavarzinia sp. TaxID=2027920 RepID=UPI003BB6BA73